MKKIPDAEFDIMMVIWDNPSPITTSIIMEQLGTERQWRAPTAISLLNRLIDRGFLRSEKGTKERFYFPVIGKDDYLRFETKQFMKTFHRNSFASFVSSLYDGKTLSDAEIAELAEWAKQRG
jgi:predicted transcriptional regulator